MSGFQPHDKRGFFMLPQAPQDAGYYVYGKPINGAAQYAHPRMLSLIFAVEREWRLTETRRFGIGNMSVAEGIRYDHATHMDGVEVDVRPVRKDGAMGNCVFTWPEYDKEATQKLIEIWFRCFPGRLTILFNDNRIPGVRPAAGHSNHFHVEFKA